MTIGGTDCPPSQVSHLRSAPLSLTIPCLCKTRSQASDSPLRPPSLPPQPSSTDAAYSGTKTFLAAAPKAARQHELEASVEAERAREVEGGVPAERVAAHTHGCPRGTPRRTFRATARRAGGDVRRVGPRAPRKVYPERVRRVVERREGRAGLDLGDHPTRSGPTPPRRRSQEEGSSSVQRSRRGQGHPDPAPPPSCPGSGERTSRHPRDATASGGRCRRSAKHGNWRLSVMVPFTAKAACGHAPARRRALTRCPGGSGEPAATSARPFWGQNS